MICSANQARTKVGTSLGEVNHDPLTRVQIAWYLVASYDRNPIHVDEPFATAAGFPSVIGQGMIPLGWLANRLVDEVGAQRLRGLGADFMRPVLPGDRLTTEATVEDCRQDEGGAELTWRLQATADDGQIRLRGWARTFHEEDGQ